MTQTELVIKQLVSSLSRGRIPIEILTNTDSLQEIGLDSLAMIELINSLEAEFGISISDEDLLNQEEWMQSICTIQEFIEARLTEKQDLPPVVANR